MELKLIKAEEKRPSFGSLKTGTVFEYAGSFLMKMEPTDGANSVYLVDGEICCINQNVCVRVVKGAFVEEK